MKDDASDTTALSSSGKSRRHSQNRLGYSVPVVAEKEQRAVFWSQVAVVVVLFCSAAIVSFSTYQLITKHEEKTFKNQFLSYSSEIISISHKNAMNVFATVESFATAVSSLAKATKQEWPFVTIPDFEARAEQVRSLAGAHFLVFIPIVQTEERLDWEKYTRERVSAHQQESLDYMGFSINAKDLNPPKVISKVNRTSVISGAGYAFLAEDRPGPYLTHWQVSPLPPDDIWTNFNFMDTETFADSFYLMNATHFPTLNYVEVYESIQSQLLQPIFAEVTKGQKKEQKVVGVFWLSLAWENYLHGILPDSVNGIYVVLDTGCGDSVTYQLNGLDADLLGLGRLHDPKYDNFEVSGDFVNFEFDESLVPDNRCVPQVSIHIYPSDELKDSFTTHESTLFPIGVIGVFFFTSLVFVLYGFSVRRRQAELMSRLDREDKIVSNLFPSNIRDRLYAVHENNSENSEGGGVLADLFPSTTVFYADIAGFTAWSSAREPHQVFNLLESVYNAFDRLAHIHDVFKVETIGDCYVAVAGLPDPREDHAVAVARFARDCLKTMEEKTRSLEVTLGPDTGDLEIRIGIHSGQVTAGVLRGERSRFQLFGDTVNTAARMESTSSRSRIQVSNVTAELLRAHGKGKWLTPRKETIGVKGKGEIQTYWLETKTEPKMSKVATKAFKQFEMPALAEIDNDETESRDNDESVLPKEITMTKMERLVEWNVDVLSKLLLQILAARTVEKSESLTQLEQQLGHGSTVLEEFREIITLPKITLKDIEKRRDVSSITLDTNIQSQLRHYLLHVARGYRENPFHNFEHASHVTASVRKLLSRIVSYDSSSVLGGCKRGIIDLVGHSYGITSDPLTQFSVVFSAVIHDMDHPGVPNTTLVKEETRMALKYAKKSVAEQNSVDLAWQLLMRPEYRDLRACIYSNEDELKRFRQLIVNTVMATDICDKELQALRKARWEVAFSEGHEATPQNDIDRKATIVIEHLIQASDVSHTMQHWQIYRQWNERLFMEMYGAYKEGRADTDPSVGWYKSEIGFFDFYLIPLARKLENCGVFGVSSHEYLNYVQANRDEWAWKGEQIVKEYLEKYRDAITGDTFVE